MKHISNYTSPLSRALASAVEKYDRIAITGWPQVGKTTATKQLPEDCGHEVFHSDDYMGNVGFKRSWHSFVQYLNTRGKIIVEGVSVAQMLEQGLEVDYVIAVKQTNEPQIHHANMATAIFTVLDRLPIRYDLIINDILTIT